VKKKDYLRTLSSLGESKRTYCDPQKTRSEIKRIIEKLSKTRGGKEERKGGRTGGGRIGLRVGGGRGTLTYTKVGQASGKEGEKLP